jgi:KTSC domain
MPPVNMVSVMSSALSAVGYDPATQQLYVRFKEGKTYTHCRVPQAVYDGLMRSISKGSYYQDRIKGKYQC